MKFANNSNGCPEFSLLRNGTAQLAHFYGIPSGGGGLLTDAKTSDEQAGFEKITNALAAALGRTNMISGMGMLEGGGILSAESLMVDNEIVGYIRRLQDGINLDEDRINVDVFKKVGVGPGKNFLSEEHTLKYFKKEMWIPELSDRQGLSKWKEGGAMDIGARARNTIEEKLKKCVLPEIPNNFEEETEEIIDT